MKRQKNKDQFVRVKNSNTGCGYTLGIPIPKKFKGSTNAIVNKDLRVKVTNVDSYIMHRKIFDEKYKTKVEENVQINSKLKAKKPKIRLKIKLENRNYEGTSKSHHPKPTVRFTNRLDKVVKTDTIEPGTKIKLLNSDEFKRSAYDEPKTRPVEVINCDISDSDNSDPIDHHNIRKLDAVQNCNDGAVSKIEPDSDIRVLLIDHEYSDELKNGVTEHGGVRNNCKKLALLTHNTDKYVNKIKKLNTIKPVNEIIILDDDDECVDTTCRIQPTKPVEIKYDKKIECTFLDHSLITMDNVKNNCEDVKSVIDKSASEIRILSIDHDFQDNSNIKLTESLEIKNEVIKCNNTTNKSNKFVTEEHYFTSKQSAYKNVYEDANSDITKPESEIRVLLIDHEFNEVGDETQYIESLKMINESRNCSSLMKKFSGYVSQQLCLTSEHNLVTNSNEVLAANNIEPLTKEKILLDGKYLEAAAELRSENESNELVIDNYYPNATYNTDKRNLVNRKSVIIEPISDRSLLSIDHECYDNTDEVQLNEFIEIKDNVIEDADENDYEDVRADVIEAESEIRVLLIDHEFNENADESKLIQSPEMRNEPTKCDLSNNRTDCVSEQFNLMSTHNSTSSDKVTTDNIQPQTKLRILENNHKFQDSDLTKGLIQSDESKIKTNAFDSDKNYLKSYANIKDHVIEPTSEIGLLSIEDESYDNVNGVELTESVEIKDNFTHILDIVGVSRPVSCFTPVDFQNCDIKARNIETDSELITAKDINHGYDLLKIDFEIFTTNNGLVDGNFGVGKLKISASVGDGVLGHDGNGKKFTCDYCHFSFKQKKRFESHMRAYTKTKIYRCRYCHYAYTQKCALDIHVFTHTNHSDKKISCDICHHKSRNKTMLLKHMRTHSEKRFSCRVCSYKCVKRNTYLKHVRKHTAENTRSCNHCKYKTTSKRNMNVHMRTHVDKKHFYCTYCSYKGENMVDLKYHEIQHEEINPELYTRSKHRHKRIGTRI